MATLASLGMVGTPDTQKFNPGTADWYQARVQALNQALSSGTLSPEDAASMSRELQTIQQTNLPLLNQSGAGTWNDLFSNPETMPWAPGGNSGGPVQLGTSGWDPFRVTNPGGYTQQQVSIPQTPSDTAQLSPQYMSGTSGMTSQAPQSAASYPQNGINVLLNGGTTNFQGITPDLDAMLRQGGQIIGPDGQPMNVTQPFGDGQGYLANGQPLTALLGQQNTADQGRALSLLNSGMDPNQITQNTPGFSAYGAPAAAGSGSMSGLGTGQYPTGAGNEDGSLMQGWEAPFNHQVNPSYYAFDPTSIANDPSYQFQLEQGQRAIGALRSAGGMVDSSRTDRELSRYNQGLAATFQNDYFNRGLAQNQVNYGRDVDAYGRNIGEYQMAHDIFRQNQGDRFNRLASLSGLGQTASGTIGQFAGQYGANAGNAYQNTGSLLADLYLQGGNAQAGGYGNNANIWSGVNWGIPNLSDLYLYNAYNRMN